MSRGSEPGARRFVDVGAQWVGPPALDLRPVSAPQHTDVPFETWGLRPAPYLRREFSVAGQAQRATLTITARGLYECWLNGARVGDHVLAPGWTDYDVRIHVQTYDVEPCCDPARTCWLPCSPTAGTAASWASTAGTRRGCGARCPACWPAST